MSFDIPLLLVALTLISGLIVVIDKCLWVHKRKLPLVIDYARALFPVFLIVLILRSFLGQGYRVPTPSLAPTLMPGDFVLVNQYAYGLHFPVWRWKLLPVSEPKNGEIAVFYWPVNPNMNFIKRVVGVPGDHVSYINKVLYINGKKASQQFLKNATVPGDRPNTKMHVKIMEENLLGIKHQIYIDPARPAHDFKNLVVPKGQYFMMGDNRDDSNDSRYWGFVPEKYLEGKAVMVLFSWNAKTHHIGWNRIGRKLT